MLQGSGKKSFNLAAVPNMCIVAALEVITTYFPLTFGHVFIQKKNHLRLRLAPPWATSNQKLEMFVHTYSQ